VLPLLPVFEKKFLIFFNAEDIRIFRPLRFPPHNPRRLNRYAFIGYAASFIDRDRVFLWKNHPVYEEPFCHENNQRARKKPVFGSKRQYCFRKSFPMKPLLCLYTCRNSDKHDGAFSLHCIAGRPTLKADLRSRAPFGYCVLFWNVFLLDLA
jgi:hypothetical protein